MVIYLEKIKLDQISHDRKDNSRWNLLKYEIELIFQMSGRNDYHWNWKCINITIITLRFYGLGAWGKYVKHEYTSIVWLTKY